MGNVPSANAKKKRQPAWNWEIKNGRAQPKPRGQKKPPPARPLFKRQPSNDYNWFLFGPTEEEKRRDAERNRQLMARRARK